MKLTAKQERANHVLGSDATHCMLYGGSRSGKTFALVRALIVRALAHESRHAILRYRFNHLKASVIYDTFPKVVELCWPGLEYKLDKSDWFAKFPNGSEVWFGGLDDKDRTEKILGSEFATIYLNECSQIPWASRKMSITRLAQKTNLRLKAYYDCNPPSMAHWTYQVFIEGKNPDTRQALPDPLNYACLLMNPQDKLENLGPGYLKELEALSPKERQRFLLGQFGDVTEGALWTLELIEQQRCSELPEMKRVVVAVDPSGCSGPEDERSDEIGIVVCGLGSDGLGYVLEDVSGKMDPNGWGAAVVSAYDRWGADRVIGEDNFGGAMVEHVIRAHRADIPYKSVKASRGKWVRAEPIAALFERQKVKVGGNFPVLEEQMCAMSQGGYQGTKSPDRLDAMVWGLTDIFPIVTAERRVGPFPRVNMGRVAARRR